MLASGRQIPDDGAVLPRWHVRHPGRSGFGVVTESTTVDSLLDQPIGVSANCRSRRTLATEFLALERNCLIQCGRESFSGKVQECVRKIPAESIDVIAAGSCSTTPRHTSPRAHRKSDSDGETEFDSRLFELRVANGSHTFLVVCLRVLPHDGANSAVRDFLPGGPSQLVCPHATRACRTGSLCILR